MKNSSQGEKIRLHSGRRGPTEGLGGHCTWELRFPRHLLPGKFYWAIGKEIPDKITRTVSFIANHFP